LASMDEIVRGESAGRGFEAALVREYLTRHIVFELGEHDYLGLETFLQHAARFENIAVPGGVRS